MIYTLTLNPALDIEYTVNRLDFDEVLRASTVRINYGGKGFNVSRMLASLGGSSVALGFIGGETGRTIQNGLSVAGIETAFVEVSEETRTNVSIVSETERHYIKVNEPGPTISAREVAALMEMIDGKVHPGDWWVLAGSLPPGVTDDLYASIIRKVQQGGAFALLDTSGSSLRAGILANPYLIKPNLKEVGDIIKREVQSLVEMEAALSELHASGVKMVLVSAGKQGALLSDGNNHWVRQAPVIQERNPIGAGDAMVAGLVWRLSQNDDPQNALAWAIACGTAAASLPGTDMPAKAQVEEFLT